MLKCYTLRRQPFSFGFTETGWNRHVYLALVPLFLYPGKYLYLLARSISKWKYFSIPTTLISTSFNFTKLYTLTEDKVSKLSYLPVKKPLILTQLILNFIPHFKNKYQKSTSRKKYESLTCTSKLCCCCCNTALSTWWGCGGGGPGYWCCCCSYGLFACCCCCCCCSAAAAAAAAAKCSNCWLTDSVKVTPKCGAKWCGGRWCKWWCGSNWASCGGFRLAKAAAAASNDMPFFDMSSSAGEGCLLPGVRLQRKLSFN